MIYLLIRWNMPTTIKTCFKCQMQKSVESFYRHSAMGDGRLGKCIECTKKDVAEHRKNNLDFIREYDRNRSKLPHRVELRAKVVSEWSRLNSVKRLAQGRLRAAVITGRIKRPNFCHYCGAERRIEAHHADYSKPYMVEWLCAPCHRQAHALAKKAA